jgi:hypothetical protein
MYIKMISDVTKRMCVMHFVENDASIIIASESFKLLR